LDAYNDPVWKTDNRFARFRDLALPHTQFIRAAGLCDPDLFIFDSDFGFSQRSGYDQGCIF